MASSVDLFGLKRVQSTRDGGSKSGSLKVSQKPFMTIDVRATGQ